MIGTTGIWGEEEQAAHIFSYGVARYIAKNSRAPIILDFGAGNGAYTQYWNEVGLNAYGFDGRGTETVSELDLSDEFDLGIKGDVVCLEVFEHIPAQYEEMFIDNLVRHTKGYLFLSVAVEGQEGLGHVNCKNNDYVIEVMRKKGLEFLPAMTKEIRDCAEGYVAYFKESLMVFKR